MDGALFEIAEFESYMDRIVVFGLKYNDVYHKFSFVTDEPKFLNRMKVINLLDMDEVTYFQHTVFFDQNGSWSYDGCCAWSLYTE
jgi:hypothetical protein